MALSYPLSFPDITQIADCRFDLEQAAIRSRSPFDHTSQAVVLSGKSWIATWTTIPLSLAQTATWEAFLHNLEGVGQTFLAGDLNHQAPHGTASSSPGTPLVAGGSQTGNTLNIDGCPNSATGYLLAGDRISVGTGTSTRLYYLREDASTNGSGEAALNIAPALRESPSDNAAITLTTPNCTFSKVRHTPPQRDRATGLYTLSFEGVEAQ